MRRMNLFWVMRDAKVDMEVVGQMGIVRLCTELDLPLGRELDLRGLSGRAPFRQ